MQLYYYTHSKNDKNRGCTPAIEGDGKVYTYFINRKEKSIKFEPEFDGYTKDMTKLPMNDGYIRNKFFNFLFNKKVKDETKKD